MATTASKLSILGGGIVSGFVLALLFGVLGVPHPAAAQDAGKGGGPQRYQISSWAWAFPSGGGRVSETKYGAYVLDTQTGDVFLIVEEAKPKALGPVRK